MNTVLYLVLAHFLADFPFQSNRLVQYKQKHKLGVCLHSLTHLVTSAVLLLPVIYEKKVWVGILIVFLMHNVIDQIKISINRSVKNINTFITYIFDQIAHLVVIGLVAYYYIGSVTPQLTGMGENFYMDQSIFLYLLVLTLSTYFYDVTRWTYRNAKKPLPYQRDYALISRNFIIVTIAFMIFWVTR